MEEKHEISKHEPTVRRKKEMNSTATGANSAAPSKGLLAGLMKNKMLIGAGVVVLLIVGWYLWKKGYVCQRRRSEPTAQPQSLGSPVAALATSTPTILVRGGESTPANTPPPSTV